MPSKIALHLSFSSCPCLFPALPTGTALGPQTPHPLSLCFLFTHIHRPSAFASLPTQLNPVCHSSHSAKCVCSLGLCLLQNQTQLLPFSPAYRQAANRHQANELHCKLTDVQPIRGSHSCLVTHPISPGSFSPQWLIQLLSPSLLSGSNNGPASSILKGCHTIGCLLHTQDLDLPLQGPHSFNHAPSPISLGTHLFSLRTQTVPLSPAFPKPSPVRTALPSFSARLLKSCPHGQNSDLTVLSERSPYRRVHSVGFIYMKSGIGKTHLW